MKNRKALMEKIDWEQCQRQANVERKDFLWIKIEMRKLFVDNSKKFLHF